MSDKFTSSVNYERRRSTFSGVHVDDEQAFVEALTFPAAVTKARRHLIRLNSEIRRGNAKWAIVSVVKRGSAI